MQVIRGIVGGRTAVAAVAVFVVLTASNSGHGRNSPPPPIIHAPAHGPSEIFAEGRNYAHLEQARSAALRCGIGSVRLSERPQWSQLYAAPADLTLERRQCLHKWSKAHPSVQVRWLARGQRPHPNSND